MESLHKPFMSAQRTNLRKRKNIRWICIGAIKDNFYLSGHLLQNVV